VAGDHTALNEMVRLSGQSGVPVIVIDGQVVVGFDRPRLEQLLAEAASAPTLGAAVTPATAYAQRHGLTLPEGLYVGRVRAGSLAARLGLAEGDVITGLGGRPVRSDGELRGLLGALRGQRVGLTYWRKGTTQTVEVEL